MNLLTDTEYTGRFAPTPTGPLHQGSLVAALASYLDAHHHHGKWLLRMEDLDPPREDKEARELIPQQLLAHDLKWHGEMEYQSHNSQRYDDALGQLKHRQLLFPCTCSRKMLAQHSGLHQGNCHSLASPQTPDESAPPHAWRLPVTNETWSFQDQVYGEYGHNLLTTVGDQVLKRKDGPYAYQLAVVVDDHHAGINHVVRGLDLLDNTPRQLYLMACLNYDAPKYLHLPLILNPEGQKLSKQNKARALDLTTTQQNLLDALRFLNQPLPPTEFTHSNQQILNWAITHWSVPSIPTSQAGLI